MSEYFKWVNPKRKEWIDYDPFDGCGFMLGIASFLGNRYTDAVCTLMAGPWRGDPVMYVGDYYTPDAESKIGKLFDGYPMDDVTENFRNVGGLFTCAKGMLRPSWEEDDDPYGDDVPYEGPFDTEVHHYRYAVNRTRGEYVDRDAGPVRCVCYYDGRFSWGRLDPLVSLLTPRANSSEWEGRWCCDEVDMLDELPVGDYEDVLLGACFCWFRPLLFADDAEMRVLTSSDEFARELETRGVSLETSCDDIELHGAVEALMDIITPRQVRTLTRHDKVTVSDGRSGCVVDMRAGGSEYLVEFEVPDESGNYSNEWFGAEDVRLSNQGA